MPLIRFGLIALFVATFLSCNQEQTKEKTEIQKRFQFSPAEPDNGTLMGVIELGGYGFNSFIINVDTEGNWKLENAQYGVSNVYTDGVTEEAIKTGLENYQKFMIDFKVDISNIHFVTSSTASKNKKVQAISKVLEELGYVVNTVDADKEAEYVMMATLPKNFIEQGYVVDIGTGNTKISWMENSALVTLETYGSGYFLNGATHDQVYQEVKSLMERLPSQRSRMCFIIGGVPFRLARDIRSGSERYTVLKNAESYNYPDDKQMTSGLNIYKAISEATKSEHYIFDWESNFSIGFLLDKEKP